MWGAGWLFLCMIWHLVWKKQVNKTIRNLTSRKQSIFNITNAFLFSFGQDFSSACENQGFKHLFFPWTRYAIKERDQHLLFILRKSLRYISGAGQHWSALWFPSVTLVLGEKLLLLEGLHTAVHPVYVGCMFQDCGQDIYWSSIRLPMLLFLVLIELDAKWAQKETIKWLQLRSAINNFFFSHSKKQCKHSLGTTW